VSAPEYLQSCRRTHSAVLSPPPCCCLRAFVVYRGPVASGRGMVAFGQQVRLAVTAARLLFSSVEAHTGMYRTEEDGRRRPSIPVLAGLRDAWSEVESDRRAFRGLPRRQDANHAPSRWGVVIIHPHHLRPQTWAASPQCISLHVPGALGHSASVVDGVKSISSGHWPVPKHHGNLTSQ
jgi:hypothetical protein